MDNNYKYLKLIKESFNKNESSIYKLNLDQLKDFEHIELSEPTFNSIYDY